MNEVSLYLSLVAVICCKIRLYVVLFLHTIWRQLCSYYIFKGICLKLLLSFPTLRVFLLPASPLDELDTKSPRLQLPVWPQGETHHDGDVHREAPLLSLLAPVSELLSTAAKHSVCCIISLWPSPAGTAECRPSSHRKWLSRAPRGAAADCFVRNHVEQRLSTFYEPRNIFFILGKETNLRHTVHPIRLFNPKMKTFIHSLS